MLRTPFQIVLGTHDATPVPAAARAHGFTHRFALVQSTHAAGHADMVVAAGPLLALLDALDLRHDLPGALYWDEARRRRTTRAAVGTHYRLQPPAEHEILAAGEWRERDQLTVLLCSEQWLAVGGPEPYHDSITYSFYSATDLSDSLLHALRRAGHEPAAIHRVGPPRERRRSRGRRLADTGFVAALGCVVLTALIALGAELLDISPRVDPWIDFAGQWLAGPLAIALAYAATYLIARRGRHPFTRAR